MATERPSARSLTEQLAVLLQRPVDDAARARARQHLVDWVGVASAAGDTLEGEALVAVARSRESGPCTTLFAGGRSPEMATLVNGGLGIVLELDDLHREAILHPGPVVIPTALAAAEFVGASVDELLTAIVRGYEAIIRVGESVGPGHYGFWHTTSTCGTFGAAAAAASLLELDTGQLVHALGNAGTQSAGLWQCRLEDAMSKPLHAGRAAQSGLAAAELAKLGFTGPRDIFEGEAGLYAATCPDPEPSTMVGGRDTWRIHTTSLKPWPGCRHVHPAIAAALELVATSEFDVRSVQRVEVRTYDTALRFADRPEPVNTAQALFSLQHAVAWTLIHGAPDLDAFGEATRDDEEVLQLRSRIDVCQDAAFDAAFPAHWGAEIVADTANGRLEASVADATGDPERPLSLEQVAMKARDLLRGAGEADPWRTVRACLEMEGHRPVRELTTCLI